MGNLEVIWCDTLLFTFRLLKLTQKSCKLFKNSDSVKGVNCISGLILVAMEDMTIMGAGDILDILITAIERRATDIRAMTMRAMDTNLKGLYYFQLSTQC